MLKIDKMQIITYYEFGINQTITKFANKDLGNY